MLESNFKREFKKEILLRCPSLTEFDLIEPDTYGRSRSDLVILGDGCWAALEFKKEENASRQPNQEWNTERLSKKGYSKFVDPDNAEEVLSELEKLFLSQ